MGKRTIPALADEPLAVEATQIKLNDATACQVSNEARNPTQFRILKHPKLGKSNEEAHRLVVASGWVGVGWE